MARWIGVAIAVLAAIALIIALGEGDDASAPTPAPVPAPTLVPAPSRASSTTSTMPAAPEPAAEGRPMETPDDARRMLQEAGIDEAELSDEVGEYMERRFEERSGRAR